MNPTHLVYAASWLRAHPPQSSGGHRVGVLPTGPFLGVERVDDSDVHTFLDSAADHVTTEASLSWLGSSPGRVTLLCIGAPALRQILPVARASRRPPRLVVVDEGIGSYGSLATRTAAYERNGNGPVRSRVRAVAVTSGRALLPLEHWPTYTWTRDGWHVHDGVRDEFQRQVVGQAPPPHTAVFLTQPWPDLGVLSEARYLSHLREVADVCGRRGLSLTLRLHPADSADRYRGFTLASARTPADLDRSVIGAAAVLGASSTALLNVSAFYGTRCFRVRPAELAALDAAMSRRQASLLDAFLPAPMDTAALAESGL